MSRILRFIAQFPGRACLYLLVSTVILGGGFFSLVENDPPDNPVDWIDGMWWAIVTLTTVGYGDFAPDSIAGRWVAMFVMAGGLGSVAILTGLLADEIREARIHGRDETPELDDDIEHVMAILEAEMDKLRARVSHPEVVEALRRIHANEASKEEMK
ncbi:ion transporter [Solirubrobacter sp. CPCC 204708]|uniref:Potassium channel family protein n=1 Tax=Solirubrobacter deserti TaxID=2282478 RepID=A0ABT4RI11_9ACTN|nr:potassium channel family protein [Solirubrobacter deserti]MBE2318812.1 ion transporter [Solirubrobacter deserti]MDA0138192.1 potassium channel family protein [Solirubrobacter deserti]